MDSSDPIITDLVEFKVAPPPTNVSARTTIAHIPADKYTTINTALLRIVYALIKADNEALFFVNVNPREYEDYLKYIDEPMCLSTVKADLMKRAYVDIEDVQRDIDLIFTNAWRFNGLPPYASYNMALRDTRLWNWKSVRVSILARSLKQQSDQLFEELKKVLIDKGWAKWYY